jgi:hypothetical protein
MKLSEVPNTKTVDAGDWKLATELDYSHIEGGFQVTLNPDAEVVPAKVKPRMAPDVARQLARDLLAQADEADRRNSGRKIARPVTRVRRFLDQQLQADDMSLAEIALAVVGIVTRGGEG